MLCINSCAADRHVTSHVISLFIKLCLYYILFYLVNQDYLEYCSRYCKYLIFCHQHMFCFCLATGDDKRLSLCNNYRLLYSRLYNTEIYLAKCPDSYHIARAGLSLFINMKYVCPELDFVIIYSGLTLIQYIY